MTCSPDNLQIDFVKPMQMDVACCLFSIVCLEIARFTLVRLFIWQHTQEQDNGTNEDNESNHTAISFHRFRSAKRVYQLEVTSQTGR